MQFDFGRSLPINVDEAVRRAEARRHDTGVYYRSGRIGRARAHRRRCVKQRIGDERGAEYAEPVQSVLTLSSRKSGCCRRVNSTAKPCSRWRTTRPWVFPSVTSAPIGGRWSLETAAPESDMSITRHDRLEPSGSIR